MPLLRKLLQKKCYDLLSHKYGLLGILVSCIIMVSSVFFFGEAMLEWSKEKYAVVFNSFSDNLEGRSYRTRLCLPVPIDVVYTWVNGSDPSFLAQLRKYKASLEESKDVGDNSTDMQENNSSTSATRCPFAYCVPASKIVFSHQLPPALDLRRLGRMAPVFRHAVVLETAAVEAKNVTVVNFGDIEHAEAAAGHPIPFDGVTYRAKQGYYTSDVTIPQSVLMKRVILMSGFKKEYTETKLKGSLPSYCASLIMEMEIFNQQGVAVIFTATSAEADEWMGLTNNFTLDGRYPVISRANLVYDMTVSKQTDTLSTNRFEDKEELRYSLRSLEQFAPWIRHVFVVTNGQIPYWVNLESRRLTIVTHEEIFPNSSHLPTFSSPAIESHLHRIPGLSDRFIYMNDDVMFGKEVWPDDFYTHTKGQKVYLSWPVPDCSPGCMQSWIKDGYCDKACNNSACGWDAGDCNGTQSNAGGAGNFNFWGQRTAQSDECNSGCTNTWIADKYCDQTCNVKACGFDGGDCGIDKYSQLHAVQLESDVSYYVIPNGMLASYFKLQPIFDHIQTATYQEADMVRAATISNKHHVLNLLLHARYNASLLHFNLTGTVDGHNGTFSRTFDVFVNPNGPTPKSAQPETVNVTRKPFVFIDVPFDQRAPVAVASRPLNVLPANVEAVDESKLSSKLQMEMAELKEDLEKGFLTEKGYALRKQAILHQQYTDVKAGKLAYNEGGMAPNVGGMAPNAGGVAPNAGGVVPNVGVMAPNAGGVAPNAGGMAPNAGGVAPHAGGEAPDAGGVAPNAGGVAPDAGGVAPDAGGVAPNAGGVAPNAGGVAPNVGGMAPNAGGVAPNAGGVAPNAGGVTPSDGGMATNAGGVAPNAGGMAPNAGGVAPNAGGVAPNAGGVAPNAGGVAFGNIKNQDPPAGKDRESVVEGGGGGAQAGRQLLSLDTVLELNGVPRVEGLGWNHEAFSSDDEDVKTKTLEKPSGSSDFYTPNHRVSRRLLDTFGDSLVHVNKLYDKAYGVESRKVPGHMPHYIDKGVMEAAQERFAEHWDSTSAHKVRSSTDMQFSFSYYYFLMHERWGMLVESFAEEIDVDRTGILSDRELRTMATRIFDDPLNLESLVSLENHLKNCSTHSGSQFTPKPETKLDTYYDTGMPQVTLELVANCDAVIELIKKKISPKHKYKFEIMSEEEISFKMVGTNTSTVVGQLDDIRRHPKKFICLNDHVDYTNPEAANVVSVLYDFYEGMFPIPSQFELPRDYRNRFLHIDELNEWKKYKDILKIGAQVTLCFLFLYAAYTLFTDLCTGSRTSSPRNGRPPV